MRNALLIPENPHDEKDRLPLEVHLNDVPRRKKFLA